MIKNQHRQRIARRVQTINQLAAIVCGNLFQLGRIASTCSLERNKRKAFAAFRCLADVRQQNETDGCQYRQPLYPLIQPHIVSPSSNICSILAQ